MANNYNYAKKTACPIELPQWIRQLATFITVMIMITLTYLMITPISQLPVPPNPPDFLFHAILYFCLVAPWATTYSTRKVYLGVTAFLLGGCIELIQPFFGRGFELIDLLANATGILAAIWVSKSLHQILLDLIMRFGPTSD